MSETPIVYKAPRRPWLALLRPGQWIKNAFVLAPLVFAGSFKNPGAIAEALIAVAFFCIAAAATYVLNDLLDAPRDREHPKKRHTRPIAAGLVSPLRARWLLAALYAVLIVGLAVSPRALVAIWGYVVLNFAYTVWLKHIPVVDLFAIAASFVLRVFAGALALDVPVSSWMFITTLSLALYLAAVKRRRELGSSGSGARSVLQQYTLSLLDTYAQVAAVGAIIFYSLFAATVRPALVSTIPLVLFGLFRYWYIVDRQGLGESPTDALWTDWPLAVTVLAWGGLCLFAVWA